MTDVVEVQIGEWIYRDGSSSCGVQIWDEEEQHYMEMFCSKLKESWVCNGYLDECITSPTTCKHAQVLNNLAKNAGITSKIKFVRSKCSFCDEQIIPKENYKEIKNFCANFFTKIEKTKLWDETMGDIIILKCGHFGHKECYDDICHKCNI